MSEGLQARIKRVRTHGSSKNLQTRLTLLQYLRDCVVPCSCTPALRRKSQNEMAAVLRSAFSCLVKTRNPVKPQGSLFTCLFLLYSTEGALTLRKRDIRCCCRQDLS